MSASDGSLAMDDEHRAAGPIPAEAAHLRPHRLSVALVHPQIAPNTGNIARLCVASGTELHLVRPLGFVLSSAQLRRSATDYWPRLKLTLHDDLNAFVAAMNARRMWMFSSKARRSFWDADYADGDCLVFGSETTGLPAVLLERDPERAVRIPQVPGERCVNLSTAAGIGLYAALEHVARPSSSAPDITAGGSCC